jgi:hypothetical protein
MHKHLIKSQITSTPPERRRAGKFQINFKLQYPMTQTVISTFFDILSTTWIWDFGHCDLFDICDLLFPVHLGLFVPDYASAIILPTRRSLNT